MFEIRCIVADKRLSEALRALKGLTLEPPVTLPVDEETQEEAAPQPKKTGQRASDGDAFPHMKAFLEKIPVGTIVMAREMRDHFVALGYPPGGYSYALHKAVDVERMLKRLDRGKYERIGE